MFLSFPYQNAVAYFIAFIDGILGFLFHVNIKSTKMVKAPCLELHCPKTLQSGDDLMYAKKAIQADPLAFTFDRVPFPVEYIRGTCRMRANECLLTSPAAEWKTTIRPHYIFHHTCVSGYPPPRPPRGITETIISDLHTAFCDCTLTLKNKTTGQSWMISTSLKIHLLASNKQKERWWRWRGNWEVGGGKKDI